MSDAPKTSACDISAGAQQFDAHPAVAAAPLATSRGKLSGEKFAAFLLRQQEASERVHQERASLKAARAAAEASAASRRAAAAAARPRTDFRALAA